MPLNLHTTSSHCSAKSWHLLIFKENLEVAGWEENGNEVVVSKRPLTLRMFKNGLTSEPRSQQNTQVFPLLG